MVRTSLPMDMMPSWWQMSGSTNDVWSVTFVIRIWRGRPSLWIKIIECIARRIIIGQLTRTYINLKLLFGRYFGITCAACKKAIVPKKGQTKAPRIRALGRDFHISCFKCEVSGVYFPWPSPLFYLGLWPRAGARGKGEGVLANQESHPLL